MSWQHVYPLNDLLEHNTETNPMDNPDCLCHCNPKIDFEHNIITHEALDGREQKKIRRFCEILNERLSRWYRNYAS
jgi:hypothetical protein